MAKKKDGYRFDVDPKDAGTPRERLFKAVASSYRQLSAYRNNVRRLNEAYAGPMYGVEGRSNDFTSGRPEKYVNLMKQAVSAYVMTLATNRPKVLATTTKMHLRPFAAHYQVGINKLIKEIQLEQVLSQWVRDAFFWMGIVRVHMADTGRIIHEGDVAMDPGMPFASNISLDNFFFDSNAKKWSECKFMGDIYRLPVEEIMDSGVYEGEALDDLVETSKWGGSEDRVQNLSLGYELEDDELEPMADLADVWLPREQVVRTYLVKSRSSEGVTLHGDHIAEDAWEGSEFGPYKQLHFDQVSDNVLPLSTAADLYALDRLVNSLYRKNARKAMRSKENPAYTPSGQDSAGRIKRAGDGEWVNVQDPREINVIRSGGVDAGLQGFMLNGMELFDRMAGNLTSILGLGAQTDTVGQEKIVSAGASGRMGQLQDMIRTPVTCLIKDLARLLWIDNFTELPARVEVEGLKDVSYDATWKPKDREGEYSDYDIECDVYSMSYQGPGQRMQALNQLLGEIYIPLMPMIQQQGGSIDLARLAELHSELLNLPRLKDVIVFNTPPQAPAAEESEGAKKAPTSTRNYVRESRSGGNQGGAPDASEWIGAGMGEGEA
jgi:hypothetical protein